MKRLAKIFQTLSNTLKILTAHHVCEEQMWEALSLIFEKAKSYADEKFKVIIDEGKYDKILYLPIEIHSRELYAKLYFAYQV